MGIEPRNAVIVGICVDAVDKLAEKGYIVPIFYGNNTYTLTNQGRVWINSINSKKDNVNNQDIIEENNDLKSRLNAYREIVNDTFNITYDKLNGLREAGECLQKLGRIVHLTGRDWKHYQDIVEQIEQELIERTGW